MNKQCSLDFIYLYISIDSRQGSGHPQFVDPKFVCLEEIIFLH